MTYTKGETITYYNPWYTKADGRCGDRETITRKITHIYRGFAICGGNDRTAWSGTFDVVFNGVCLTMVCGLSFAKKTVDDVFNETSRFDSCETSQIPLIKMGLAFGKVTNTRDDWKGRKVEYKGKNWEKINNIVDE